MAYRKMYEAIGVKNIDQVLPPPPPPLPKDPALENIDALGQKTVSGIPWTGPSSSYYVAFKLYGNQHG